MAKRKKANVELKLDNGNSTKIIDDYLKEVQSHLVGTGITVFDIANQNKTLEIYIRTEFMQDDGFRFNTFVPYYSAKYYNLFNETPSEVAAYLISIKQFFSKEKIEKWKEEQKENWANSTSEVTKPMFFQLMSFMPEYKFPDENGNVSDNPNRRIQELKQRGYHIASIANVPVIENGKTVKRGGKPMKKTMRYLLPLPTYESHLHEIMTRQFVARVRRVLKYTEAFENKKIVPDFLIPDHKFPEVRWAPGHIDDNPIDMSEEHIKEKFQLLDNQRNEQKREVCRKCYERNERGIAYGIPFFYKGNSKWDSDIPKQGKEAKDGCIGCPWYDFQEWRKHLKKILNNNR